MYENKKSPIKMLCVPMEHMNSEESKESVSLFENHSALQLLTMLKWKLDGLGWSVAGKLFTVSRVLHAGPWKTETRVWRRAFSV